MNNVIHNPNPELGKYQQLAEKCMKLVKNKLYFKIFLKFFALNLPQ